MELPRATLSLQRRLVNRSTDFSLRKRPIRPRRKATVQLRETRARLQALQTVLPRSSSPSSPLHFPSDPDLDHLFPELQAISSQSFLTFFDLPVYSTPQPTSYRTALGRGNSLEVLGNSRRERPLKSLFSPESEYWSYRNRESKRDILLPAVKNARNYSGNSSEKTEKSPNIGKTRSTSADPKVLYYFQKTEVVHKAYLAHIGQSR